MTSLEVKLRTSALAYPDLATLLTNSPAIPRFPDFRWYDTQLLQGTVFPAIVVQLIAGSQMYGFARRLSTGFSRMQFTVWDTDPERARTIEATLYAFLDQFSAYGLPGLSQYSNNVVLTRQGMYPQSQPPQFWRINDVNIFENTAVA